MRSLLTIFFLLLAAPVAATDLLSGPPAATAIDLWGGAHVGMTVEQVEAVFPDAARNPRPSRYRDDSLNLLSMRGAAISGFRFRVDFTFLSGKLTDVRLRLDENLTFNEPGPLVQEIRQSLTAKYGAPFRWEERKRGTNLSYDGTWRHEGVVIDLNVFAVGKKSPALLEIRHH